MQHHSVTENKTSKPMKIFNSTLMRPLNYGALAIVTSSSAVAERPRCSVCQFGRNISGNPFGYFARCWVPNWCIAQVTVIMHSFSVTVPNIAISHAKTKFFGLHFCRRHYASIFNNLNRPKKLPKRRNKAKYGLLRRSRSFKVTDFGTYATSY